MDRTWSPAQPTRSLAGEDLLAVPGHASLLRCAHRVRACRTRAQAGATTALVVYNLLFLGAYALAFLATYLLARELGASQLGRVAAGAAFAYALVEADAERPPPRHLDGWARARALPPRRGYRGRRPCLVLTGWLVASEQLTLGFTLGVQLAYLLAALGALLAAISSVEECTATVASWERPFSELRRSF